MGAGKGAIRFLPVGPQTLLAELDNGDAALALLDALLADPVPGLAEIVPAARTLMIRTEPGIAAGAELAGAVLARQGAADPGRRDAMSEPVEIPMTHDGPDLADVAAHLGLGVAEVIAAHCAAIWRVAFCGFAPGFAYMTCDDPRFDLPRRASPRTQVPAGSVALAARYCGIYPQAMPGGWQVIGTTRMPMWDLSRDPAAALRPGMRVRFVRGSARLRPSAVVRQPAGDAVLHVVQTVFPILFQDGGRAGQAGQGVPASGALDRGALRRANRAVGNPPDAAALEITLGPVHLQAAAPVTLALAGAGQASLNGRAVAAGAAFAMDPGDWLAIAPPDAGLRSYLALRGGWRVAPVLGSASTDTLSGIGPAPLETGAALCAASRPAGATAHPEIQPPLPRPGDTVVLPVTLGPRTDWFTPQAVAEFLEGDWLVTPRSSRVGLRLSGRPVTRAGTGELPSEGCETGAVQIPHSGEPVLFLADHPLTGGYPVIATVLPSALDLAGQIPPGVRIGFTAATPFHDIRAQP